MAWNPPDNYEPIRGVSAHILSMNAPQIGSAEFKLVVMVTHSKSPHEVGLTREMARQLIDDRIVPTGLYPSVLAVALGM